MGKMLVVNNKLKVIKDSCFREKKTSSAKFSQTIASIPNKNSLPLSLSIANILIAMPAHSEAGKIFDFNATLPIMAIQFLILMVFIEKVWFGPVGEVISKRNRKIEERKTSLATGTEELENLQKESENLIKDARAEAKAKIVDAKTALNAKAESELAAEKSRLDQEIALAVKELSDEKASAQKNIDLQVAELSKYIIKQVLPSGYTI